MAVPNLEHVVHAVRNSRTWNFTTKEGLCEYNNAVVLALHATDANFGHLKKSSGQNHCVDSAGNLHSVDVTLYKPNGTIVDFIQSAGYGVPPPANAVTWQPGHEGEYPPTSWYAPVGGGGSQPEPGPTPPDSSDEIEALQKEVAALWLRVNALESEAVADRQRMEAINARLDQVDRDTYKRYSMPEYIGAGKAPTFGGTVTVISTVKT